MNLTRTGRVAAKVMALPAGAFTRRRAGDHVVLLYHRVGDSGSEIEVSADTFERHLQHLAAKANVMTIDDVVAAKEGGVAVTFDDGYKDFTETVVPLLVKYAIPATLYLATALVSGEDLDAGCEALSWQGLRDAVSTGLVTIGSHTHTHANLARSSGDVARQEMSASKDRIEQNLQVACRHFAYPWAVGSADADAEARRLFDSAAWDAWRTNRSGRTDPYRLGRTPVLRSDGALFTARAKGMLDGERVVYRAMKRGPWGRA